jgi:uncharacterized protein (DUF1800 family)
MRAAALESLDRLDPAEAWKPWQPTAKEPWGVKWAGHLYRRAAFGASIDELRRAAADEPASVIRRLLEGDPAHIQRDQELAEEGKQIAERNNAFDLRGWWLDRMLNTHHPLREKMTLFWHNHFATSINKIMRAELMHRQNDLLRTHALAKFGPMLQQISKDPAMLIWLDSNSNVKGKPNENYGRELMELFSLGVHSVYTEKDIREAARAFTGWHTDGARFVFKSDLHDDDNKTVLGKTGNLDGGDVVEICLSQDVCARFLVRKMYRFFVSESVVPPDSFIEPLAETYRKSGYDTALVVKTMLSSRHFFSAHAYRHRVKSPVEYCLGLVKALGRGMIKPRALVPYLELMGQHLFAPPNVKGWEGGTAWLNTATILVRHNMAYALTLGGGEINLSDPDPTASLAVAADPSAIARRAFIDKPEKVEAYYSNPDRLITFYADLLLQGDVTTAARARLKKFMTEDNPQDNERDRRINEMIHALLTAPEYQLA